MPALRTVKTTDVEMVSSGGRSALRGALTLTLFAGTLAACGNPEIDSETDALEAVAIEPSAVPAGQDQVSPARALRPSSASSSPCRTSAVAAPPG